ncbi:hypothetical protein PM082_005998 [Marasmius tenuissimus]|nr:hypothetical protein PM082_005998 [Marasmius tenuissimus]
MARFWSLSERICATTSRIRLRLRLHGLLALLSGCTPFLRIAHVQLTCDKLRYIAQSHVRQTIIGNLKGKDLT